MAVLKYNSKGVDRSGGSNAPAPANNAIVKCKVHQCQYEEGKGDDPGKLVNIYAVTEGPSKGYWFWDRISMGEASAWRLDQFLLAMGIDTVKKPEGSFDPSKFKGKELKVRVKYGAKKDDGSDEFWVNAGQLMAPNAPVDEKLRPSDGAPSEEVEDEETWTEMGARIDADEENTGEDQEAMLAAAEEVGLDPNEYTWTELGVALDNAGDEEGDGTEPDETEGVSDDEDTEGDEVVGGEANAEEIDFDKLGADGDKGDVWSIQKLEEQAELVGVDPNDYATWAELATALAGDPFAD